MKHVIMRFLPCNRCMYRDGHNMIVCSSCHALKGIPCNFVSSSRSNGSNKLGKDTSCVSWKTSPPKPEPGPKPNDSKRGRILLKAMDIINGERQDEYGNPEDSFRLIGEYWTIYLEATGLDMGQTISPKEVAEMMMLFKIARMSGQKPKLDNYLDLVGYAGLAADMVEGPEWI